MSDRDLGKARNDSLRAVVRKLKDEQFGGNLTATAKAIGVSPAALHDFLGESRGAGMKIVDGLTRLTGKTVEDLMGRSGSSSGPLIPPGRFPRYGDLPGWPEAVDDARRRYGNRIPAVAFDHAGDFMGMDIPAEIDARTVYNAAKLWWESRSEDQQSEAIAAQARAEMAAEDAEAMDLLKRGELRDEIAELKRQADSAKGKLKADAPVKPRKT